jgi:hypothetical protein
MKAPISQHKKGLPACKLFRGKNRNNDYFYPKLESELNNVEVLHPNLAMPEPLYIEVTKNDF